MTARTCRHLERLSGGLLRCDGTTLVRSDAVGGPRRQVGTVTDINALFYSVAFRDDNPDVDQLLATLDGVVLDTPVPA
jgi:hypothetical protein